MWAITNANDDEYAMHAARIMAPDIEFQPLDGNAVNELESLH